jgi:hypothetical protein
METDWQKMRAEYVAGTDTYAQLAEKYGVHKNSVVRHGKEERWQDQRRAFRQSVATKAIGKARDRQAEKLERLMVAADAMVEIVERITSDKQQFFRQYEVDKAKDEETGALRAVALEYVTRKADMKALKNATSALNELTKAVRNLYDLPTGEESRRRKLEERKMKLMERREGAEVAGSGGVIEIARVLEEQQDGQEVDT